MTRVKLRFLTFSGIDGCGKSTQIALAQQALGQGKQRVRVDWYRPGYSTGLDKLRRGFRRLRPGMLPPPGHSERRERAFGKRVVSGAWFMMACLDMIIHYGLKTRIQLLLGFIVICDRYIDDAVIDLELRFPSLTARYAGHLRFLRRCVPSPDVAILLTLPYHEVESRLSKKSEPFSDAPNLRRARHRRYDALGNEAGYTTISAEGSIQDVHERIMGIIR